MRSMTRALLAIIALIVGSAVSPLHAQGLGTPPTAAQCEAWARDLAAGGPNAQNALTYGSIADCPDEGPALAAAVRSARSVEDTTYLSLLAGQASRFRDPAVFDAALTILADRNASPRARVMSLMVTAGQLGSSPEVQGMTPPEVFTRAVTVSPGCGFTVATASQIAVDHALPADHERRAARVIDGIRYANGEPTLVQNLARCSRSLISTEIPPQVDVSKIRLDYVCGNSFRIQNHTPEFLILSYTVAGIGEAEDVTARSGGGWTSFTTDTTGTVKLTYDGQVVATVANTGKSCGGKGN